MKLENCNFTQPTNLLYTKDNPGNGQLSCDQVWRLLEMANRYLPTDQRPSVSKQREMKRYAMLYEIMDLCNLRFADADAMRSGTPKYVARRLCGHAEREQRE